MAGTSLILAPGRSLIHAKTSTRAPGFEAIYPHHDQLGWALAILHCRLWLQRHPAHKRRPFNVSTRYER